MRQSASVHDLNGMRETIRQRALERARAAGFETVEAHQCAMQKADEMARHRREMQEQQETLMMRAASSGLPPRHLEARAESEPTPGQAKVAAAVAAVLEEGGTAALVGPRGTGKTFISAWLIDNQLRGTAAGQPRYIKAVDLFRAIRATFSKVTKASEEGVISKLAAKSLLIIDEVHERSGSDWELTILADLIDRRYGAKRPTLLVSNQTAEGLAESLGPSIVSRIREDGDIFELAGENYRERLRRERAKGRRIDGNAQ